MISDKVQTSGEVINYNAVMTEPGNAISQEAIRALWLRVVRKQESRNISSKEKSPLVGLNTVISETFRLWVPIPWHFHLLADCDFEGLICRQDLFISSIKWGE